MICNDRKSLEYYEGDKVLISALMDALIGFLAVLIKKWSPGKYCDLKLESVCKAQPSRQLEIINLYLYFFLNSSAASFNSTEFFCIFFIAFTASSTPFGPARKIFSSSHTASCSQARCAAGKFMFSKSKYSGKAFGTASFDLCGWNKV